MALQPCRYATQPVKRRRLQPRSVVATVFKRAQGEIHMLGMLSRFWLVAMNVELSHLECRMFVGKGAVLFGKSIPGLDRFFQRLGFGGAPALLLG
jgi:hypothetical protein